MDIISAGARPAGTAESHVPGEGVLGRILTGMR